MSNNGQKIRAAIASDLPFIVRLLADDDLGSFREDVTETDLASYNGAFHEIQHDPNSQLLVAVSDDTVVGCLQLTIIPGLSFRGSKRCQIEDVRVLRAQRGSGIGTALLKAAEKLAIERGCFLLQLLVHRDRTAARQFYSQLEFEDVHQGLRKVLKP